MGMDLIVCWAEWPKDPQGYYIDDFEKCRKEMERRLESLDDDMIFAWLDVTTGDAPEDLDEDNPYLAEGSWRDSAVKAIREAVDIAFPVEGWSRGMVHAGRVGQTKFLLCGGTSGGDNPCWEWDSVAGLIAMGVLRQVEVGPGWREED